MMDIGWLNSCPSWNDLTKNHRRDLKMTGDFVLAHFVLSERANEGREAKQKLKPNEPHGKQLIEFV